MEQLILLHFSMKKIKGLSSEEILFNIMYDGKNGSDPEKAISYIRTFFMMNFVLLLISLPLTVFLVMNMSLLSLFTFLITAISIRGIYRFLNHIEQSVDFINISFLLFCLTVKNKSFGKEVEKSFPDYYKYSLRRIGDLFRNFKNKDEII